MTSPPGDGPPPGATPPGWGFDPRQPPPGYFPYPTGPVPPPPGAGPGKVKAGPAILGFLIGAVASVGALMTTTLFLIQIFDARDTRYTDSAGKASIIASLSWAVVASAMLVFPKTRRAGAGLLAGVAVGMILLSGVCAAIGVGQV